MQTNYILPLLSDIMAGLPEEAAPALRQAVQQAGIDCKKIKSFDAQTHALIQKKFTDLTHLAAGAALPEKTKNLFKKLQAAEDREELFFYLRYPADLTDQEVQERLR